MLIDKGADVMKYMKPVLLLSDALGLKKAVDQMVGKCAGKKSWKQRFFLMIVDNIFVKSDSYLRTNEHFFTATSVFAGSWIESLY